MNFHGPESGDEHTLSGRLIPLFEAFQRAIKKAAKQPLPEPKYSVSLPVWCHKICDQLTKTVFKSLVGVAPQGEFDARHYGRLLGMLLRGAAFVFKEAPAQIKREGLSDLSPAQEQKLEKMAGLEVLFRVGSERFQKPIHNEDELVEAGQAHIQDQMRQFMGQGIVVMQYLVNRSAQEQHEFLCGIPEGFVGLIDSQGEVAGRSKRYEMYLRLLGYWPEIAEMQRAQPPKTRHDLLEWLEQREGRALFEDAKVFYELCGDIDLDLAPPGHPQKPTQQ
ncbi:MAG TPA: hypothetical protein VNT99_12130 [Methylomirabilota bacterium]|nr:hypothetical protein [Methylomirabilota bacterium]